MTESCACKGDYLEKFIQPCVMMLLCAGPAHGFKLFADMRARGLTDRVDATGFYRTLKKLEQDGKLTADWVVEPGQKPRRVFALTDAGLACLRQWQLTLNAYKSHIDYIAGAIEAELDRLGPASAAAPDRAGYPLNAGD